MEKITYSVKEAAQLIGIGTSKMYQMVRADKVPNIKLDGRFLIPKAKFLVWINLLATGGNA